MLVVSAGECDFIKIVVPPSDKEQTVLVGVVKIRAQRVRFGVIAKRDINVGRGTRHDKIGDHINASESDLAQIPTAGSPR